MKSIVESWKAGGIGRTSRMFFQMIPLLTFLWILSGTAFADKPGDMPPGPAPTVTAQEVHKGAGALRMTAEGVEKKIQPPSHPPINQIPPMPMPYRDKGEPSPAAPAQPGTGIMHNTETGETITLPASESALQQGLQLIRGYNGADGGDAGAANFPGPIPSTMNADLLRIGSTYDFPDRMNVKLVIRKGTGYFVCSGSMIDASYVLTAGHCVYDRGSDGTQNNGWMDEVWVYPGWDGGANQWAPPPTTIKPFGYAKSRWLNSWSNWTDSGNLNADIGGIALDRGVGMLTGWYGMAYGGSCAAIQGLTYYNYSYPAQDCGFSGLHTGLDMYFFSGNFNSCPSTTRLGLDTPGTCGAGNNNCLKAVWGGMSGSGMFYMPDASNRYVHAVTSTSNRCNYAEYTEMWQGWVDFLNTTSIHDARGDSFDLQPLNGRTSNPTVNAGAVTTLNHQAVNATNGTASTTWFFSGYLSPDDTISAADTYVGSWMYPWDFSAMSQVNAGVGVTIPKDTPEGDYWLGVVYDPSTDGNSGNNATVGWDAAPIHVHGMPDLVIQSITVSPASPTNSPSAEVTVTFRNEGGADAVPFYVDIFKDLASPPIPSASLIGDGFCRINGLAAGATSTCVRTVSYANPGTGSYSIWATVDSNIEATESFEDNNVSGPFPHFVDAILPTVNSFSAPATINSLTIPITAFTAGDDSGVVAGYLITTSAAKPSVSDPLWSATIPTTFNVGVQGSYNLYAWALDPYGNVSNPISPVPVNVDTDLPSVSDFSVSTPSHTLSVPIGVFSSNDNTGVTGWLITLSNTKPAASDPGWSGTVLTTFPVPFTGHFTLHPWVKDAAGNVSDPTAGTPIDVTMLAPGLSSFILTLNYGDVSVNPLSLFNHAGTATGFGLDQQQVNTPSIPATGLPNPWTGITPLPTATCLASAAVVGGKFYVIGGEGPTSMSNLGKTQVYSPTTGLWDDTLPPMPFPRWNICAGVIGSDIYIPGGSDISSAHSELQVFHTATNSWEVITSDPLPSSRWGAACASYNNLLYVFGGMDSSFSPSSNAWVYVPSLPAGIRWISLAPAPLAGYRGSALPVGNRIFYSGMQNHPTDVIAFNPSSNTWTTYPSLNNPRWSLGMWALDNVLYLGGGTPDWVVDLNTFDQYDVGLDTAGTWLPAVGSRLPGPSAPQEEPIITPSSKHASLPDTAFETAAAPVPSAGNFGSARRMFAFASDPTNGLLYAAGGYHNGYLTSAETSVISSASWLSITPPSGNINAGSNTPINVNVDTSGLTVGGTYRARVALMGSAPNTIQYLPVTLNVIDTIAPTVTAFAVSQAADNFLKLNVTSFSANDNHGVAAYKVTDSPTPPEAGAAGWSPTVTSSYTLASYAPSATLYAWAKDSSGNVSEFLHSSTDATASLGKPIKVQETGLEYTSLQTAYNAVGTTSATINAWATLLPAESVVLGSPTLTTLSLNGGYDSAFGTVTGMTSVSGSLTMATSSIIIDRIIIR